MTYSLTTVATAVEGSGTLTIGKKASEASFARAILFASKAEREGISQAMYATYLGRGQFRPIVTDILAVCFTDSERRLVQRLVPMTGGVKKDAFVELCQAAREHLLAKTYKKDGTRSEIKGQKLFMFELMGRIVEAAEPGTVDAE